jgi:peptidoglycan-associated lipoprotein
LDLRQYCTFAISSVASFNGTPIAQESAQAAAHDSRREAKKDAAGYEMTRRTTTCWIVMEDCMSKATELGQANVGAVGERVNSVVTASKEGKSSDVRDFSVKEIGILAGVIAMVVGITGYGFLYQHGYVGSIATPSQNSASANVSHADAAPPLDAAGMPAAQAATPIPVPATPELIPEHPAAATPVTDALHADIYFDFNRSRLRDESKTILREQAEILKKDSAMLVVQGYADQAGPVEYNKALGLRRAESVKQYLVGLGVPEPSIKVASLGKAVTICDQDRAECRQHNRRAHLEVRIGSLHSPSPISDPALSMEKQPDTAPIASTIGTEKPESEYETAPLAMQSDASEHDASQPVSTPSR